MIQAYEELDRARARVHRRIDARANAEHLLIAAAGIVRADEAMRRFNASMLNLAEAVAELRDALIEDLLADRI